MYGFDIYLLAVKVRLFFTCANIIFGYQITDYRKRYL